MSNLELRETLIALYRVEKRQKYMQVKVNYKCCVERYLPVPGCGSSVVCICNYWPILSEKTFSSYRELKAVHACPLQNVCGPYLPLSGCGSLVITKV